MSLLTCPKCGGDLPEWVDPKEDEEILVVICQDQDTCIYVPCDDIKCRALIAPVTTDEWERSSNHWRAHRYLLGCSHGN